MILDNNIENNFHQIYYINYDFDQFLIYNFW